jgi:hypothetical protein
MQINLGVSCWHTFLCTSANVSCTTASTLHLLIAGQEDFRPTGVGACDSCTNHFGTKFPGVQTQLKDFRGCYSLIITNIPM